MVTVMMNVVTVDDIFEVKWGDDSFFKALILLKQEYDGYSDKAMSTVEEKWAYC